MKELKKTGNLIAQDYQIVFQIRKLRSRVVFYHDASVLYWLRKEPEDLEHKNQFRQQIFEVLKEGPGEGIEPKIKEMWEALLPKVQQFVNMSETITDVSTFLSPTYMKSYRDAIEELEELIATSSNSLEAERERNEEFQKMIIRYALGIFSITLTILLLGLNYFLKYIIQPVLGVIKVVDNIRSGDLTAYRPEVLKKDEIGRMADTVNRMAEELAQRRKERVEFIGAVAHDIRNPLNTISLSYELAQKRGDKMTAEEGHKIIGRIGTQVERLNRLTDDLLQAAKESKPIWLLNKTTYRINEQIKSTLDDFRELKKDHEYQDEGMDLALEVTADKQRISQVLHNLLSNSTKYSPSGTVINVRLSRHRDKCIIEIVDQGSGIPNDKKESIFLPFSRLESTKDMAEGTGLGLAIVKDIVEAHKGSISVHDNLPKGSVFRIELPLASTKITDE